MGIKTLPNYCRHCLTLGVMLLVSSCINDPYDPNLPGSEGNVEMNITMSLPKIAQPSANNTRALASDAENEVAKVNVLVFTNSATSGTPTWGYAYNVRAKSAIANVGDSSKKKFTVSLLRSDTEVNLVILANADTEVTELLKTVQVGDSKNALLAKLISKQTNAADHIAPPFPMHGEVVTAITDQISTVTNVPMMRSIARVDLAVSSSVTNFTLKEIYIYNTSTKGQIVSTHISSGKAIEPTLPTTPYVNSAALSYTVGNLTEYKEKIYLYEAPKGTESTSGLNTALVIGGYYNGSTTATYYRLDFISKDKAYLPVLRNHLYEFRITKVGGRGYTTVDEAWNATESTMEGNVTTWDQGDIGDIVFNNENFISFTPGREVTFAFNGIGSDKGKTVNVKTDCESGFIFTKFSYLDDAGTEHDYPNGSDWFEIDKPWGKDNAYGKNGETVPVKISVNTVNNTINPRIGFIYLLAGSLEAKIKVWQDISNKPQIHILDYAGNPVADTLIFIAPEGEVVPWDKKRNVYSLKWHPAEATKTCTVTGESPYEPFPLDKMNPQPDNQLGGSSVEVNIAELDPMSAGEKIKLSTLTYTAAYNGEEASAALTLIQTIPFIEVLDLEKYYTVNGTKYSFRVKSNRKWKITNLNEPKGENAVLAHKEGDTFINDHNGGIENGIRENVISFTTVNSSSTASQTVTAEFQCTSPDLLFKTYKVTMNFGYQYFPKPNAGWAGSFIYWDGTKMTFDDVNITSHRQAQGLLFKWGGLEGISPKGKDGAVWSTGTVMYKHNSQTTASQLYAGGAFSSISFVATNTTTTPISDANGNIVLQAGDRNYLYEAGKDICAFITAQNGGTLYGKKWRMPVYNELQDYSVTEGNYTKVGNNQTTVESKSDDGTFSVENYYTFNKGIGTPGFAVSGYRSGGTAALGKLTGVGTSGGLWSGSPRGGDTDAYYLNYGTANPRKGSITRQGAYPVRCVISTD